MGKRTESLLPVERITSKIFLLRNEKVLIDRDLAELYGVEVKKFNQAVKRNIERFPNDFMFRLTAEEYKILRSQIVTSSLAGQKTGWGGRRYLPLAFTEQGVAMLSSVLNSERAVQVNIAIMRAFVQMRMFLQSSDVLAKKLNELEKETKKKFAKQQEQIKFIFEAIKELMLEKAKPKRKIGF
ncbi:MAG: ORF6N domain-containing protein [Ignavibacteriales bacterium]|nr:ORF6N domain-containing protein [Ignavibacteriales bacterium]